MVSTTEDTIRVKTTLPSLPRSVNRHAVYTKRLILRPLSVVDLKPFHELRTQQAVMQWTSSGRVDRDISETQAKLAMFLEPNDTKTFNCAICLKTTGDFIGVVGVYDMKGHFSWPELGYMIKHEYWGQGFGTEFVQACIEEYARLPRVGVVLEVPKSTLDPDVKEMDEVDELLSAIIEVKNVASGRILQKCGFENFVEFLDLDPNNDKGETELAAFRWRPVKTVPNKLTV
ncbi:acyl-CoA N-acyltransferase [Gonapodya prolifera JEL478]|uniref:Acyl-CoA N-acyltransferase n=1 Tax=Gonapodya prolifera (strain JEL478) TaxID=1344416 RepID=A0A139AL30_GONPJ|nr:acyl-CoA N-acyltransferase [Gonapodya prolifera JEL478]|eukprot:KXS17115.1 acyl-CoA N-acyltransferase [Gonapodya prolifera JEL478]